METQGETAVMREETGLFEESTYACISPLEDQFEDNLTACSVSTTNSYECTFVIESLKANAFLVTVTREVMVAFAIERHFDRQVITECLGIRNSLVSLREKTCA